MQISAILAFILLFVCITRALSPKDGFYVMAHMSNNRAAADWALSQGANALEMDLRFSNGIPSIFQHGGVCDCICSDASSICGKVGCSDSVDAISHMTYLANKTNLALVMIDSKVDFSDVALQNKAGASAVDLLVTYLFGNGFGGEVVVSVAKVDYFQYLYQVVNSSNFTPYASRFHFTFDEEADIDKDFQYMLQLPTKNRIYGTGNSACLPGEYLSQMQVAESNRKQGVSGLSYVWTMNFESTMRDYFTVPVGGIMTNYPQRAYALAISQGYTLATQATRIPAATSDSYDGACNCAQSGIGCKITTEAPKFTACKCNFELVKCSADVVSCRNSTSPFCITPTTSVRSCLEGDGNCGGYEPDCECKYNFAKGCVINRAAPSNTACKCTKVLTSCYGTNVICNNNEAAKCVGPDTSKASCLLAPGGNCGGY